MAHACQLPCDDFWYEIELILHTTSLFPNEQGLIPPISMFLNTNHEIKDN